MNDLAAAGVGREHRSRTGFFALCERETVRVLKIWSQTIVAPVVTALLYIGVFGLSIGDRIGRIDGHDYVDFILPGILLLQVSTQAFNNNSSSVYQARFNGSLDDILASPMHAWQIAIGVLWGGVIRASVVAIVVLLASMAISDVGVAHPFEAAVLLLLVSILWGAIGVIVGVFAKSWDSHAFVGNLVITPLVWVGGVFYSVDMLPSWVELATRFDPLFYQVNGLRHAFLGTSDSSFVVALAGSALLAAAAVAVQVWIFATGYKLKD